MYLTAKVTLCDLYGNEDDYEVGAEVDDQYDNYGGREVPDGCSVGDPDISGPGSTLDASRIVDENTLEPGWSDVIESALSDAWERGHVHCDADAADYMYGED